MKRIYIIAGGTVNHVRPHFAVCAPAYGNVGVQISEILAGLLDDDIHHQLDIGVRHPEPKFRIVPIFTRMAEFQSQRWQTYGARPAVDEDCKQGTRLGRQILEDAGLKHVETNQDLQQLVDYLKGQEDTRAIVMAAAVCDWEPSYLQQDVWRESSQSVHLSGDFTDAFGKDQSRLTTRIPGAPDTVKGISLHLKAADKIIGNIRNGDTGRKDIFLVSFKATAGLTPEETYAAGLKGLKGSSSNLVFANDVQTGTNVVVTPEEFPYFGESREDALGTLCEMILGRTQLTFTRTKVMDGERANIRELHEKGALPPNFLPVLEHLIKRGAYKVLPWKDSTSGHFGCIVEGEDYSRISSVRKANHNLALEEGVAKILGKTDDGRIIAVGARPSVGEHTQEQIYDDLNNREHKFLVETGVHSIVHFHCPLRPEVLPGGPRFEISRRPQKMFECGSDQCGINTATGMKMGGIGVWAVHLEGHGPNIAFDRDVPAEKIISFIERHWDLDQKSGGLLEKV